MQHRIIVVLVGILLVVVLALGSLVVALAWVYRGDNQQKQLSQAAPVVGVTHVFIRSQSSDVYDPATIQVVRGTVVTWARVLLFAAMLSLGVLLTACGGSTASPTATPSATSPAPMTVTVTLTDFKIASDQTQFKVGVPYHFVVVNKGATEHELMIAPPMTAGMTLEQIDDAQLFEAPDIEVGQTKTVDYIFKASALNGTWEFACHEPGHYEAGMKLPVTIVA